jgi:uncharacterized protein
VPRLPRWIAGRGTELPRPAARVGRADGAPPKPPRPILPPFTEETAQRKVKLAEDAWNTRDPDVVALAYTEDSEWRNRTEFLRGREEIRAFLIRKWRRELGYRLRKELWAFSGNRISVRFEYESHDATGQWWRSHGNEHWEFDEESGLMRRRDASINDYRLEQPSAGLPMDERARVAESSLATPTAPAQVQLAWLVVARSQATGKKSTSARKRPGRSGTL